MQYKTMTLELLRERTELYERLRVTHTLLPTLETCAMELKASHETWQVTLTEAKPDSQPSQVAREALEMALKELEDRLPPVSLRRTGNRLRWTRQWLSSEISERKVKEKVAAK